MTQSKPTTTLRQQRMPTVSWGDIIPLGGPRFSRSLGFLGVSVVNLWVLCSSSSSVCSLQSPQGISDCGEGLGPDVDLAKSTVLLVPEWPCTNVLEHFFLLVWFWWWVGCV